MKKLPKVTEKDKKIFSDFLILAASPDTTREQFHDELRKLKKIEEDEKISDPIHLKPPPFDNPR